MSDTKTRRERRASKPRSELSPPPYEAPETRLERLGPGLGYMAAVVGGALILNLLILAAIAAGAGG